MFHEILYKIGFTICHQIPERSFFVGGEQLPLCSRCTGIYLGVFIMFAYYFFTRFIQNKKPNKPPKTIVNIFAISSMFIMATHAFLGAYGILDYSIIRFATGLFFGVSIPLFLIPVFNYSTKSVSCNNHVINNKEYFTVLSVSLLLIIPTALQVDIYLIIVAYLSIFGLLTFILLINASVVTLIFEQLKGIKVMPYYNALLIGTFLTGVELYLLGLLHALALEKLVN